jgi:ferric-dicitrate binding protein FerR (iron transport regulator)
MAGLCALGAGSLRLAGLLLALAAGSLGAQAEQPAAGLVLTLKGSAAAVGGSGQRPLSPEDALFASDTVATAAKSRIEIRLGADTRIALGENGRLKVGDVLAEAGGAVELEAGAILVDKDPASAGRPLQVDTTFGQIAVRGTSFFAGPSRGSFGVFLVRGKVVVTAGGQSVELEAGEGTEITTPGAPPSAPIRWKPERIDEALAQFR